MSLKETIQADVIAAMKAREMDKLGTLRLLSAAIKQREVDTQSTLDDAAVIAVIEKACKQRRESISQYQQANRPDLVQVEQFELDIISAYLPAQMSDEDITSAVSAVSISTALIPPCESTNRTRTSPLLPAIIDCSMQSITSAMLHSNTRTFLRRRRSVIRAW